MSHTSGSRPLVRIGSRSGFESLPVLLILFPCRLIHRSGIDVMLNTRATIFAPGSQPAHPSFW
jgi:hypothetical protein